MKARIALCLGFLYLFSFKAVASDSLYITEVFPNPLGEDKTGEFIEIVNISENDIPISDITIDTYPINSFGSENITSIKSKSTLIIHDDEIDIKQRFPGNFERAGIESLTSRGLSNTGDKVELKYQGQITDTFEYSSSIEGVSIIKPVPDCSFALNIASSASGQDIHSIAQIDDIFNISDFGLNIAFYYENEWSTRRNFENATSLPLKLIHTDLCNFQNSGFKYTFQNQSYSLTDTSTINASPEGNNNYQIELTYQPVSVSKTYSISVNNTPLPTQVITPDPTTIIPSPVTTITPEPISTPLLSPTPTSLPSPTPISTPDYKNYTQLRINEIYPSPKEMETEWLELYNYGNTSVNLSGFILKDLTGSHILIEEILNPGAYLVIEDNDLKITLNNSGDTIQLFNPAGTLTSNFKYDNAPMGTSYIFYSDTITTTTIPTKGTNNLLPQPSESPDLDPTPTPTPEPTPTYETYLYIKISAIYPNPAKDEKEWLELFNNGSKDISLDKWVLKDQSRSQKLPDMILKAGEKYRLTSPELKLSLNNSGETITLYDPNNQITSSITYPKSEKGKLYPSETTIPTDSGENQVEVKNNTKKSNFSSNITNKIDDTITNKKQNNVAHNWFKLPNIFYLDTASEESKVNVSEKKPEEEGKFIIRDSSLLLLSLAGFLKTPIGKAILDIGLKKLEALGN